ncbi:hypothetical protein TTHERM_00188950 (macronuclear) [Tetrahymena thermophila SB210]|uniref:Uncharacterized protein n=1 Tax=Tetrahymena thermophila (strain SB210) TaxID=312017 RepID=I7M7Z6_TETTS|nr:hypothetical protein TTHERM_00188950 [Tetrahymena thermophila SB210]EAR96326.1 hypothetical protein TTHERM_00188950 [Tetrahymena thermophila SB210]|eukprot:XP_001016571.1 hypothetical protein TTHERM_00188950 [Tetrahymena thermophila SB210]
MSKRASRQASKLEEKTETKTFEEEIPEENPTKKQFNSKEKTTTTTKTQKVGKESAKEPVKMSLAELKNLKNLRSKQEHILMNIENQNIENHVQTLLEKFDPPYCANCKKRRADRVCINKACGQENYMQVICGKCHLDEHQKTVNKSEIDIEEYFIKLSKFINEQKYDNKKNRDQRIDLDNLDTIFDELDNFRQKLTSLRAKIESEIESYISPQEMQSLLQNCITKALSLCEYDNIQEQLVNIKKSIIFEKNKFIWNDASQKFLTFSKIFNDLDKFKNQTNKKISQSFIGGYDIYLDELVVKNSNISGGFGGFGAFGLNQSQYEAKANKDGEIVVTGINGSSQFYIDYNLDRLKKYKLRFRFNCQPQNYIMVGVMQKSLVHSNWVYNIPNQYFCKRFLSNAPNQECSKLIQGIDLSNSVQKDKQIEMRIDIENNYVDFYDYPDIKNINASLDSNRFADGDYIIAFAFYQSQSIVIESFQELFSLDDIKTIN